jgi:CBS domain-containing protein
MISVDKLFENKDHDVWCAKPDDTVFDAVKLMEAKDIGALAVIHDGTLVGLISERDCAREVILKNCSPSEIKVKDIMTRNVYYTFPEQNIDECLGLMTRNHIRHLPVMKSDKMVGMISIGDVVKTILVEKQIKIDQLEHYISWEESY